MSLYQNVRPKKLEGVKGNTQTVGALQKILKQSPEKRPHAFLLYGPSGTGKTTLARILCSEFGCSEHDIFELNAANTRGIDSIRDIISKVKMKPMDGKAKAYILDESHQLTAAAQEALLKVLEETPEHVYFFLCTTDPQALIKTIRNRCSEFMTSPLGQEDVFALLDDAMGQSGITVSDAVLVGIIEACVGSSRKALVLLETAANAETEEDALALLVKGTERDAKIIDICKLMYSGPAIRKKKWKHIFRVFDSIEEEPEAIRRSIMGFLYKHLLETEDENDAIDIANLLNIFSVNAYYGGKTLLGAQIARACFEIPK